MRQLYLEAMGFLMINSLVVQLYMYLFLQIPDSVIEKVSQRHTVLEHQRKTFMVQDPTKPSEYEAECIQVLTESRYSPIVRGLFTRYGDLLNCRLVPYLNGKSHLEEIIFEEGLTKKELKLVMSSYREEIVSTLHG